MPYFPAASRYSLPYRAVVMREQRLALARASSAKATATKQVAAQRNRKSIITADRPPVSESSSPKSAAPAPTVTVSPADFGAQGGDPSRGVDMDLSTCVNRYGPAPAALAALHAIEAADIVLHPYAAAEELVDLYRWATGVGGGTMIAGRGASEFIWAMGRELDPAKVQVPLPAYTDYLKAFPGRGFSLDGEQIPSIAQVRGALDRGGVTIISNPHNPTGVLLDPKDLTAAAQDHPAATLVVDESYVNFTRDPIAASCLGCDMPNVVVLRSTSKFYGIAATRAGIAWSAESALIQRLFGQQENWGLSGVDVRVASAAVRDFHWSTHSRVRMHADNVWLGHALSGIPGVDPLINANVHFQYAFCRRAGDVSGVFQRHGIGVRVLGAGHGVRPDALRIVAPRDDERERFSAAVTDVVAERVSL